MFASHYSFNTQNEAYLELLCAKNKECWIIELKVNGQLIQLRKPSPNGVDDDDLYEYAACYKMKELRDVLQQNNFQGEISLLVNSYDNISSTGLFPLLNESLASYSTQNINQERQQYLNSKAYTAVSYLGRSSALAKQDDVDLQIGVQEPAIEIKNADEAAFFIGVMQRLIKNHRNPLVLKDDLRALAIPSKELFIVQHAFKIFYIHYNNRVQPQAENAASDGLFICQEDPAVYYHEHKAELAFDLDDGFCHAASFGLEILNEQYFIPWKQRGYQGELFPIACQNQARPASQASVAAFSIFPVNTPVDAEASSLYNRRP